jgi:hypothetical protein
MVSYWSTRREPEGVDWRLGFCHAFTVVEAVHHGGGSSPVHHGGGSSPWWRQFTTVEAVHRGGGSSPRWTYIKSRRNLYCRSKNSACSELILMKPWVKSNGILASY